MATATAEVKVETQFTTLFDVDIDDNLFLLFFKKLQPYSKYWLVAVLMFLQMFVKKCSSSTTT